MKTTARNILELDVLGSFDFYTLIVSLDSLDLTSIESFHSALQNNDMDFLRKIMPLIYHEYRHYLDSTSSLWGIKHMKLMNDGYTSRIPLGGTKSDFYKAKIFENHINTIRFPESYTEVNYAIAPRKPWSVTVDVGAGYTTLSPSSRTQCLYANFYNSTGNLLVKSPIAPISILEASAMCAEICMNADMILSMDDDYRSVASKLYSDFATSEIYNPEMIEYYICPHLLAQSLGNSSGIQIFRICEYICRVTLNISTNIANQIADFDGLHEILNVPINHPLEILIKRNLRMVDIGVIFTLISFAMPTDVLAGPSAMKPAMEVALKKLGVSLLEVETEAMNEAYELYAQIENTEISSIRTMAYAGMENMKKIKLTETPPNLLSLLLPPVYLGDCEQIVVFGAESNRLQMLDIDDVFEELYEGQKWVEQFRTAFIL